MTVSCRGPPRPSAGSAAAAVRVSAGSCHRPADAWPRSHTPAACPCCRPRPQSEPHPLPTRPGRRHSRENLGTGHTNTHRRVKKWFERSSSETVPYLWPEPPQIQVTFGPALACLRLSPLLRIVLWWGSLPRPSSVEQFHRWSRSWCWHSWMATWMPCRAEAVTSGLRTHIRIWRLLRPASLRHTELGVRTGSPATFRLRISLHSTLQRGRRGREKELVWGVIRAGQEFISQIQRSMWQLKDVLDSYDNQKNTKRFKDKLENVSNLKGIWQIKLTIKRVNRLHKNLQVFPLMLLRAGKNIILNRSSSWEITNAEDELQNTFYGKITTKWYSLHHCLDR